MFNVFLSSIKWIEAGNAELLLIKLLSYTILDTLVSF